jgi:hypothetical protein
MSSRRGVSRTLRRSQINKILSEISLNHQTEFPRSTLASSLKLSSKAQGHNFRILDAFPFLIVLMHYSQLHLTNFSSFFSFKLGTLVVFVCIFCARREHGVCVDGHP